MSNTPSQAMTFDQWFAEYLDQDRLQVERLLRDRTATRFLIAWSLFESRCFEGSIKIGKLSNFAEYIKENGDFRRDAFLEAGRHFHSRYQIKSHYRNLMYKQRSREMEEILSKQFDTLTDYQLIFMLLLVVYRFRNNIFHGNKGVDSWLKYKQQIVFCLDTMQPLISLTKDIHKKVTQAKAVDNI